MSPALQVDSLPFEPFFTIEANGLGERNREEKADATQGDRAIN